MRYKLRNRKELFVYALLYPVIFVAGFAFVCYAWVSCFRFQHGLLIEAPYFLVALFASLLLAGFVFRLFTRRTCLVPYLHKEGNVSKSAQIAEDDGIVSAAVCSEKSGEKTFAWILSLLLFGIVVLFYVWAISCVGFLFSSFFYLLLQSLLLRSQVEGISLKKLRPWLEHTVYAISLTVVLAFLFTRLFVIRL